MVDSVKNRLIVARLTLAEHAAVLSFSDERGLSLSRLVREGLASVGAPVARSPRRSGRPRALPAELPAELLAKVPVTPEDIRRLAAALPPPTPSSPPSFTVPTEPSRPARMRTRTTVPAAH
ncbi:hypothetical protein [Roseococcus pinisoli]|uniref:Ribbon-helix-helix protein CopG domain-containing protein n=1 Tax=Roseococcus pinisoli TaxID=2835040 RepID=A0ABS5QGY8_9PROT|nr:hypothetical protein [Roseococcus pinisoli]MBS7812859.1 hypothetical protein [Roseococcus pinisoli]